ncbi:MAG TPA: BBP7 family outer membrane beta-barrel protein [Pirellulaceae bacterium]|nr:BBP7 family outer membrane beta-barrel protein [Pirellulaceae bacterium]
MKWLHGRGAFWALCALLLAGRAHAQTYPYTSPSVLNYPSTQQPVYAPAARPAQPVYGGGQVYNQRGPAPAAPRGPQGPFNQPFSQAPASNAQAPAGGANPYAAPQYAAPQYSTAPSYSTPSYAAPAYSQPSYATTPTYAPAPQSSAPTTYGGNVQYTQYPQYGAARVAQAPTPAARPSTTPDVYLPGTMPMTLPREPESVVYAPQGATPPQPVLPQPVLAPQPAPQPMPMGGGVGGMGGGMGPAPGQVPVYAGSPQPVDAYQAALAGNWDGGCNSCGYGPCGDCNPCQPVWFVNGGGVFFGRSDHDVRLSCYESSIFPRSLYANDASMPTTGGPMVSFGRYFAGGNYAAQVVYWGLYPGEQTAHGYANNAYGNLETPINFNNLFYDDGVFGAPAASAFNNAIHHQVWRNYSISNVEINFLVFSSPNPTSMGAPGFFSGSMYGGGGMYDASSDGLASRWRYSWLAGFRTLQFKESLLFGSDPADSMWGNNVSEIYYHSSVSNRLAGFQVGGRTEYYFTPRVSAYSVTKGGVYGNHMEHAQRIYNGLGTAWVSHPGSPYYMQAYDVSCKRDNVSLMGELQLGVSITLWRYFNVYGGYQFMAASGVAEVSDQFPSQPIYLNEVSNIKDDGVLILHGAVAGISFNW